VRSTIGAVEVVGQQLVSGFAATGNMADWNAIAGDFGTARGCGDLVWAGDAGEIEADLRVGADVVGAVVVLFDVARRRGAGRNVLDAGDFTLVEEGDGPFGTVGLGRVAEISDELAFVAPGVFDDAATGVGAQVVHDELPFAAEVARGERHHRVDLGGFTHQRFHCHPVPNEVDLELGVDVGVVDDAFDALGGGHVGVGEYPFQSDAVGQELVTQGEVVIAETKVADAVHDPVLVENATLDEILEAEEVGEIGIALDEGVAGDFVGDIFGELGHPRDAAEVTIELQRFNLALEHLDSHLGGWQRVRDDPGAIGIGREGERRHRAASDDFGTGDSQGFSAHAVADDDVGRVLQVGDDAGELLFGAVGRHHKVEAEELRGVGFLLELVAVAGRAKANEFFVGIARGADAVADGHVVPATREVGEDAVDAVKGVRDAVEGRENAGGDVADPAVGGRDVFDDFAIEMFGAPDEEVGETFTSQGTSHRAFQKV